MASSLTPLQQFTRTHPHKFGAMSLLLGAALVYWNIISPIQQAQGREAVIRISSMQTMFGIGGILVGAVYLVFGARFAALLQPSEGQSKIPAYTVGAVTGLVGLAIFYGIKSYLEARGYSFHR